MSKAAVPETKSSPTTAIKSPEEIELPPTPPSGYTDISSTAPLTDPPLEKLKLDESSPDAGKDAITRQEPSPESEISSTIRWKVTPPTVEIPSYFFAEPEITPEPKPKVGEGKSSPHAERITTRSMKKKLEDVKTARKYDIKPLSQDWEKEVESALKQGHGTYQPADFQKVVPANSARGGMSAWLNDETINGYLKLITQHGNKDVRSDQTPRFHAFSTFFYTNLASKGCESVRRWANRARVGGKNMLKVEKLFIPINPNNSHWTLCVVEPSIKHITHYNSLGSSRSAQIYLKYIKQYLAAELGKSYEEEDWVVQYAGESPQQTNGADCGVFAITTAKHIMLGMTAMSYGAAQIPTQRRRIVAELIAGHLLQNE